MKPRVKPQVLKLVPYPPGTPRAEVERRYGVKNPIKLASNENPFGPAPSVVAALTAALPDIGYYPDGASLDLRNALAAKHQVRLAQLCVGNGSDELLQLLGYAMLDEGDELVIGDPTFARYAPQATINRAVAVKVPLVDYTHDLDGMAAAVTPRTKLLIVANPHNPTGTFLGDTKIEAFLDQVPEDVLVVLDEAYYEFTDDPDHGRTQAMALARPNVIVLRTFSKIHALAALRIGYSIANEEITGWLHQVREPFNTNALAHVAALAALEDEQLGDQSHVARTIAANRLGRQVITEASERLGLRAIPSQSNFVLIDLQRDDFEVYEALARKGYIVRACGKIGVPDHLRVTVGTPEQCQGFVAALEAVLQA